MGLGVKQPDRLGESLGICAGDTAFFLAFQLLSSPRIPPADSGEIMRLWFQEITQVCVAQMQDVLWGSTDQKISEEQILELYRYKTARYTFSLPLVSGAVLAHAPAEMRRELDVLGEYLGLIFQIKDDELGIYASEEHLGKPIGSDIREGKKTLYYSRLMQKAGTAELERLRQFGTVHRDRADLEFVRGLIESLGIRAEIQRKMDDLARKSRECIDALSRVDESYRELLLQLLDYSLTRHR
jgi:geranylgeranyl diphosphate synthase type I